MASLDSSIRSAARATSSAYKRLPIRWRLAGGSAALTLVILLRLRGDRRRRSRRGGIQSDFNRQVAEAADQLAAVEPRAASSNERQAAACSTRAELPDSSTTTPRPQHAAVRVVTPTATTLATRRRTRRTFGPPLAPTVEFDGLARRDAARSTSAAVRRRVYVQYARRISDVEATANRVRFFLALGVLGGAALALLAGLATARRAMEPIAELTEAARDDRAHARPVACGSRTPRPTTRSPSWRATLDGMLHALDDARAETEATLARQREFVADASHELRTPLTSVLANLELLEEDARRRAARGRGVRPALLAPDAPAGGRPAAARPRRRRPRSRRTAPVDLSDVVTEAAAELEPVAGDHEISVSAPPGATIDGRARRAAPAGAEPDGERAAPHRSRARPWRRRVERAQRRGRARRSRTTARASRRSCTTRCSSASSAARATARARPGSGSRSSARSRSRTTGRSRSRSRWTAAAPASSCASRPTRPPSADAPPDRGVRLSRCSP